MALVHFHAGAAVSWTVAILRTELLGTSVRRHRADLTGQTHARVYAGGGTNCPVGAEAIVEYTTDLTGAAGWASLGVYADGADGPLLSLTHTGDETHYGPFVEIAAAAKGPVLLRVAGQGGDGATGATFGTIGLHYSVPRYASQSLEGGSTASRAYIACGASHAGGGGDVGEFGLLPAPLRAIPSGATCIRNGAAVVTHDPDEHGIEAGILAQLSDAGKASGCTLVCRYVGATSYADWTTTHLATLAADCVTAGITPCLMFTVGFRQVGSNTAAVADGDRQMRKFRGKAQSLWPGIRIVSIGPTGDLDVSEPFVPEARIVHRRNMVQPWRGRLYWLPGDDADYETQVTNEHPTSAGTVAMGRDLAAAAIAAGIT